MKTSPKLEEFKLRIAGVELGKHSFSVDCDKTFFELADIPDLHDGLVKLQIEMDVSEKMILLDFHFHGYVMFPCDRCLDPVKVDLDFNDNLVVKLVPLVEEIEEEDNLWIVNENEYELDLYHFVYEAITLALPSHIVHPDDENGQPTCNPKVLETLKQLTRQEDGKSDEIDPRWEALKNIKK